MNHPLEIVSYQEIKQLNRSSKVWAWLKIDALSFFVYVQKQSKLAWSPMPCLISC